MLRMLFTIILLLLLWWLLMVFVGPTLEHWIDAFLHFFAWMKP